MSQDLDLQIGLNTEGMDSSPNNGTDTTELPIMKSKLRTDLNI